MMDYFIAEEMLLCYYIINTIVEYVACVPIKKRGKQKNM